MIITEKKDFQEVLNSLDGYKRIVVLGCSECADMCKTGGEEQVDAMAEALMENGKEVPAVMVITTSCNDLLTRRELKDIREELDSADAVLSLACGNGVQTLSKFIDAPVLPGNNTVFVGERVRGGIFEENCRTCGECVLGRTAAVCPVSRCAKGLLNGACGGSTDGKCEVDPEKDCAWVLIYNRLLESGKESLLEEIQPLRDYSASSGPRSLNLRKR